MTPGQARGKFDRQLCIQFVELLTDAGQRQLRLTVGAHDDIHERPHADGHRVVERGRLLRESRATHVTDHAYHGERSAWVGRTTQGVADGVGIAPEFFRCGLANDHYWRRAGAVRVGEVAALEQRYAHSLEITRTDNAPINGHCRIGRQHGLFASNHGVSRVVSDAEGNAC